jgi:hypothetical protein
MFDIRACPAANEHRTAKIEPGTELEHEQRTENPEV